MRSFIFNFKFILFFFLTIFILNFISNILYIHILNNSEFRLSKILINKEALNSKLIFIGNSRSVEFNKNISDEIFNSSYNGLAYEQIDLLIEKINEKNNNHTNPIYIEVSSLYDEDLLGCDFIIYLKNSKKNNCKKIVTFSNYFPSYLFSNEIFLRNIYFYLFNASKFPICAAIFGIKYFKYGTLLITHDKSLIVKLSSLIKSNNCSSFHINFVFIHL
jgi:hypothetical protein